ncbi:MAG: phosphatidate cytidylyltransferase [candidate division WOR-3 bacterium]
MKSNFRGRLIIGLLLALLVSFVILRLHPLVLAVLTGAWSILATLEFLNLLRRAEILLPNWLILMLEVLIMFSAYFQLLPEFLILTIAFLFITPLFFRSPLPRIPVYSLFTVIYLGYLPAHLILLRQFAGEKNYSAWLVLFPLALTWLSDTGAYAVGKILGRKKIAPRISPNKTLEGAIAGLATAAAVSSLWLPKLPPFSSQPFLIAPLTGIFLSAAGQTGDLFESIFKRAVDIKDSGRTLGEHGGFLDRVDSLLFALPAFYYLVLLIAR